MYHPQDEGLGQPTPEAPNQHEPVASAAGDSAQAAQGAAPGVGRRQTHVSFLAEIARAMQAAAAQERERIHAGLGEEESSQIEKVHVRATAEAAALRQGADDDMRLVDSWCEEQIRQIHLEASRRIDDRRRELEQSVTQHGSLIETEVESVHGAVRDYRDSLDAFFARMAQEGDPSAIAGLAGTLPDPPDLDVVRADARSRAMRELEEQESAQADSSTDEGPTDGGPTSAGPTEEFTTGEVTTGEATTDESPTGEVTTSEAPTGEVTTDESPTSEAPTGEVTTSEAPTGEVTTSEAPTGESPTEEVTTDEGPTDAAGTLPPSVEELVPVMEPESVAEPLPVMDPEAAEASHENVAFRMLHSLTGRTSPTGAPEDKGSSDRP